MIPTIGIGLGLALIGLGVLGILYSGIQSLIKGKVEFKKVGTMLIPFVVFGISYGVFGDITEAGVATMIFMMATMILLIFLTGLRGTLNI